MSLNWDTVETATEVFDRLLPTLDQDGIETLPTEGKMV